MRKYVIAIDQGTTSTRALLLDFNGRVLCRSSRDVECLFPKPGWVEANAEKIFISVIDCINELLVLAGTSMEEVACIGLTNQRETTVLFEKKTGKPVYNAIVWQSKQTQSLCEEREQYSDFIQSKTGLRMNPYFSASKIRYILDHVEGAEERAKKGEILFGTIDTYVIYLLTRGKSFVTDASNDVSQPVNGVHITGVAGDQQAALFGQCCFKEGDSKNTYGTGCFMLMNIGKKPILSQRGLLTTVAWREKGELTYALEGSVFIGGAIVQWLRDQTRWISVSSESEEYAKRKPDTAGVYFVPAFVGLGTPWWDDDARGAIFGLTRGADRHNITRAALYSIAYQSKDVIEAMKAEAHLDLPYLRVDGGASANGLLMQFQADILQCDVVLPSSVETTAIGAGYLAMIGAGIYKDKGELIKHHGIDKIYHAQMGKLEADKLYEGWLAAVKATMAFKH